MLSSNKILTYRRLVAVATAGAATGLPSAIATMVHLRSLSDVGPIPTVASTKVVGPLSVVRLLQARPAAVGQPGPRPFSAPVVVFTVNTASRAQITAGALSPTNAEYIPAAS